MGAKRCHVEFELGNARLVKLAHFAPMLALLALAGGCVSPTLKARRAGASVVVGPEPVSDKWKGVASAADQDRIDRLGLAWQQGLMDAKPRYAKEIEEEGDLLKARSGLPFPAPTPGSYNCRMDAVGSTDRKTPAFQKFKPFFCYVLVDQGQLTIVKQTGSRRPAGRLWEDDDPNRMVFLGSLALGDEKEPGAYGDDPDRDMAGVFERIGPFRWRLVIPWPRRGGMLDVFELTPATDQPQE